MRAEISWCAKALRPRPIIQRSTAGSNVPASIRVDVRQDVGEAHLHRFLDRLRRPREVALGLQQAGEVVEATRRIRMLGAKHPSRYGGGRPVLR